MKSLKYNNLVLCTKLSRRKMKKYISTGLSLIFSLVFCTGIKANEKYKPAIDYIINTYPEATLQDIYKSFFQDKFGPEHIVSDTVSARKYLLFELLNMGETSMPYYEPAGTGENFIRVSLQTVKDSLIFEDELLKIFIESANTERIVSVEEWKEEWETIKGYVPTDLKEFKTDDGRIDSVLNSGHYAIHHSRIYNDLYHPHYRIIRKDLFKEKILPKLKP